MRGYYRNNLLGYRKVAAGAAVTSPSQIDAPAGGPVTSPSQTDARRPAQSDPLASRDLNQEADLLFWSETHYKPGKRLDPHDPSDRRMIPAWLDARDRVAQSGAHKLRQSAAVRAALDANKRSGLPYFVYSRGGPVVEALAPFADVHQAFAYARARSADSDYVAYFAADDPHWPSPAFENIAT